MKNRPLHPKYLKSSENILRSRFVSNENGGLNDVSINPYWGEISCVKY